MKQENTKQEIIRVIDEQINFWTQFKEEISSISEENSIELIHKWHNYFKENVDSICNLGILKMNIEEIENNMLILNEKFDII